MLKNRIAHNIHCNQCAVNYLCLAGRLEATEIEAINNIISHLKIVPRSEYIFHARDKMSNIYAVYQGVCKSGWVDIDGTERIENFYLPGDIIGMESIPNKQHLFSAMALEEVQLCVIPLEALLDLMGQSSNVLERVVGIASYKMQNDQYLRNASNAHQRVAVFIINMLSRLQERKMFQGRISVPILQLDIANFLGLAPETVNRILKKLQKEKIIVIETKTINIINIESLKKVGATLEFFGQS